MPPGERKEPGRRLAVVLAILVHLIFIGLLVFGVNWQTREASPVVAELWSSLSVPAPKAEPRPEPEPEVKPEPRPEPKPESEAKPEPKVEPKPSKADIELKAKEKEKKRKEEEKKKRAEEEKRKKEDLKRRELEQKALKEQARLDEQRKQREAAEAEAQAKQRQMAAQAAAQSRLVDDYRARIRDKIKRYIVVPPDVPGNPQAEFEVTLMPTGEVLNARLTRSSGNAAYDSAVERAIYKAQPLPLPPDTSLFGRFRELQLKFRLNE